MYLEGVLRNGKVLNPYDNTDQVNKYITLSNISTYLRLLIINV